MILEKLLNFQRFEVQIGKDSVASVGGGRQYRYASLPSVLSAIKPALSEAGLVLTQRVEGQALVTELCDPDTDEKITGMFPLSFEGLTWHQIGSAITYARRYSLLAVLGLAPDEDDDAIATLPPQREQEPIRNKHSVNGHNGHSVNGTPHCPQCDNVGIKSKFGNGYYCGACRKPYTGSEGVLVR